MIGFTGQKNYSFSSTSDLTILHNASSWHALFLFHGYAREHAYADRCLAGMATAAAASEEDDEYQGYYNGQGSKDGNRDDGVQYIVRNHPLPLTTRQTLEIRYILSIFASIFILIALCYVPAAFVTFTVKERFVKAKHLQLVSGGSVYVYWLATYLWDVR